jgi:hypothetical protein
MASQGPQTLIEAVVMHYLDVIELADAWIAKNRSDGLQICRNGAKGSEVR